MASCCMPGWSSIALFTCTAKLDPGAHGARGTWGMTVHHAVGIRNSGYRPSRVNMAQGLSTPDPSLSPTHLSIRKGRATTTHYTHTIRLAWSSSSRICVSWTITVSHETASSSAECSRDKTPFNFDGVAQHYTSPGVVHWGNLWGRPQRWHARERVPPQIRKKDCC